MARDRLSSKSVLSFATYIKQLPLYSRRNMVPAKCIAGSLVMGHQHAARALIELMQIGETPAGTDPGLHHPPKAFNGIEVVPTMGREQMQPKLAMVVRQR